MYFKRRTKKVEKSLLQNVCKEGEGLASFMRAILHHGYQMAKFDPFLSLDCARVEGVGVQSRERKGSNFAAQHSGAIVQKPEGPNT